MLNMQKENDIQGEGLRGGLEMNLSKLEGQVGRRNQREERPLQNERAV